MSPSVDTPYDTGDNATQHETTDHKRSDHCSHERPTDFKFGNKFTASLMEKKEKSADKIIGE
jgi:hypothetical protein